MKVKIFSVRPDESFRVIRVDDETGKLSSNEYLEKEAQPTQHSKPAYRTGRRNDCGYPPVVRHSATP